METTALIILAVLIVAIFGMFLVSKFNVKIFGLDLSYSKADNANKVHELVHLALDHQKEIFDNNDQIIKNQMTFCDGILMKIANKLEVEVPKDKVIIIQHLIHEIVRDSIKENGFTGMGPSDFAQYVSTKTLSLRQAYSENIGQTKFVESHDFSNLILDMYTHAANCANFWTEKSVQSTIKYQKDYDEKIKEIK